MLSASSVTELANSSSSLRLVFVHLHFELCRKNKLTKKVDDWLIRGFFPYSLNPRNYFQHINFFNNFRGFAIVINPENDKFQKTLSALNFEVSYYTCILT